MLIHAVWEDGKVDLPEHIKPKHTKIKVVVDFPESEIEMDTSEEGKKKSEDQDPLDVIESTKYIIGPPWSRLKIELSDAPFSVLFSSHRILVESIV
jgi:hypothetical protein